MYKEENKMADLMASEPQALQIIARFNIPLGVGNKTIADVCCEHGVDVQTFLTIINYRLSSERKVDLKAVEMHSLLQYLRNAHDYFLSFLLPRVRQKIIEAMNYQGSDPKITVLIIQSFDRYSEQISAHMTHENEQIFPYVESLLRGERNGEVDVTTFAKQHHSEDDQNAAEKLSEVKSLIIRYYPSPEENNLLYSALYDLFVTERDFATHCDVEDAILFPLIKLLEKKPVKNVAKASMNTPTEVLSNREKEVLI
ncbi:MAG: hemerythrin domain-containing protein, partial [Paludibacteraceae bacterium]|nr:hemerythrin domain-containing protein [Paludibacteraceae bacterium]